MEDAIYGNPEDVEAVKNAGKTIKELKKRIQELGAERKGMVPVEVVEKIAKGICQVCPDPKSCDTGCWLWLEAREAIAKAKGA